MASPRHEITISEIAPQAHVNHPRPATEQVKDDASVHSSQILPSSTVPGPSDTALPHQPIYGVPWMMMPMPVMLPPHHHSQVIKPERQEPLNMIMDPVNIVRPAFEESPTFDSGARVPKDRVSKMNNEHWVPITILAEFRKVKELTGSLQEVVDALRRSPAVTVDDTGTMVKPVTVDRPRTTLLLRELPEDTTEEVDV
ncbi:hypothetical protein BGZ68_003698 [Mortierella alpina]|nr:hypothetical protein BGZ68_003698 [Mortierella alpina]